MCVGVEVEGGGGRRGEGGRLIGDLDLYARWRGDKGFLGRGGNMCKSMEA